MQSNNSKHNLILTYIIVTLSMMFWGMTFVWTKDTLEVYNPITIITIRLIISSLFLMLLMVILKRWETIKKKDLPYLILLAFLSPFLYFIGETYGIDNASSTASSVMIATIPIFSTISAYFIYKEKLTAINFIGMGISFIGLFLVVLTKNLNFSINLMGLVMLLLAVFSSVTYVLVLKKFSNNYGAITIVAYQNLIGFLMFLPLFFIFEFKDFIAIKPSTHILKNILMLSIFGSSLAFVFFTYGNKKLGVSKSEFFANLIPIFTAITAYFVLGERLTWFNILGIFIVIFGLTLAQRNTHKKDISNLT